MIYEEHFSDLIRDVIVPPMVTAHLTFLQTVEGCQDLIDRHTALHVEFMQRALRQHGATRGQIRRLSKLLCDEVDQQTRAAEGDPQPGNIVTFPA